MKRFNILLTLILTGYFILHSCAPYKMKAIRAQRDQRYSLAIKFALKHLSAHPNDPAVIKLLNNAARNYYADLNKRIQHFENLNDWPGVVQLAEQGYRTLSEVTSIVGTEFPTRNELEYLQSKSEQSRFNQADELYSQALKFYQSGDYLEARTKFKEIQSLVRHFKDTDQLLANTHQKLAAQNYQQAQKWLNQGNLESALESFELAAQYVPDFLDVQIQINQVKDQLADSCFNQGQNYLNSGDYIRAHQALEKSLDYKPAHSMAVELLQKAKDRLTVRLAVFPFSSSKLDQKFGGIVAQQILARALSQKSEFVIFLEREHLQKIFEEQALSQTGAIDEKTAVQVGKLSGVNTIIVGSVTLISDQTTGPLKKTLTAYYDKKYRDPKGIQRTKREPFNYTESEVSRTVELNLSYRLINVESGIILFNESIAERATDVAQWVACPQEFVTHLSVSARSKLKAATEPRSKDSLINQALDALTKRAAAKVMSQVAPSW